MPSFEPRFSINRETSLPGQVTTVDQDSPARQIGCGGKGESFRTVSAAFPSRSGFVQHGVREGRVKSGAPLNFTLGRTRTCSATPTPNCFYAGGTLKVQRIVANIRTPDPTTAHTFYADILGLDLLMDMTWIRTYGSRTKMSVQISFMSEGGSATSDRRLPLKARDGTQRDSPRRTSSRAARSTGYALPN